MEFAPVSSRPPEWASAGYAGFWVRFGAAVIDALIVQAVSFPVMVLLFGTQYFSLDPQAHAWDLLFPLATAIAVVAFWRLWGATPGKLAMGLRIVDVRTGARPPLGRLVLRFVCYALSAAPLYLGFLWIAVDRRKQGWHDKIAKTAVIHEID